MLAPPGDERDDADMRLRWMGNTPALGVSTFQSRACCNWEKRAWPHK